MNLRFYPDFIYEEVLEGQVTDGVSKINEDSNPGLEKTCSVAHHAHGNFGDFIKTLTIKFSPPDRLNRYTVGAS